ncbi:MAG: GNAT family N-acetyltransferase [Bacteroidota bacterium]
MNIRFLTAADSSAYKALRLNALQESPFAFSDSYEDQANKTDLDFVHEIVRIGSPLESFALGAFSETNDLVGFVKFKRDQRTKARHRASLHSLYVTPALRGTGIAHKLMIELLKNIEPLQGIEQLQLSNIVSHNSLVDFYQKYGFQILGGLLEKDLIIEGKYVDAVYMVKHLKNR